MADAGGGQFLQSLMDFFRGTDKAAAAGTGDKAGGGDALMGSLAQAFGGAGTAQAATSPSYDPTPMPAGMQQSILGGLPGYGDAGGGSASAVPPGSYDQPAPSGPPPGGGAPSPPGPAGPTLPPQVAPSKGLAAMGAKMPMTSGQAKLAPLGEQEYQDLAQSVQNAGLDSLTQQRAGIDDLVKKRDDIAKNPYGVDLSPLLALGDAWNPGASTAKSYARPESPEDRRNTLLAMDEKLQGMRGSVSKDDIELLKSRLADQGHRQEMMQRSQDRSDTIAEKSREFDQRERELVEQKAMRTDVKNRDFLTKAQTSYNASTKEQDQRLDEVKPARDILHDALTTTGQMDAVKTAMARIFSNRINESERQGFSGGKDWNSKLDQMLSTAKSGTITPENYKALSNILDRVEQNSNASKLRYLDAHAAQYAQGTGLDMATARSHIAPILAGTAMASGGDAGGDLATGAQAELQRRAKAKAQAGGG